MNSGLILIVLAAQAAPPSPAAKPVSTPKVTFHKDVAPILFEYCAPCHRPGDAAPFPLLRFEDAKRRSSQIVDVTARRYMPPWPPEPGIGDFRGSRRLSNAQLAVLRDWARQGSAEGDPSDAQPPPQFTDGWQLGPPDLILETPRSFELPASGPDVFRNFVVPVPYGDTRWVRAIELRPGNKKIVHHANIVVDRTRSLRAADGLDGQPGFAGMEVITESGDEFDPDSHFLFWKPGTPASSQSDEMSWKLGTGTDLILNLHLRPSGKPERVQPSVGLYFTKTPPTKRPMLLQLEHDGAIDVPPGSRAFVVADHFRLPVEVDLLGIYPHAHYIGKRIEAWAIEPGGKRIPLLQINDWDINWQASYEFAKPVRLPRGTQLGMRITYDNSDANPRNPLKPPRRVRAGNRSEDEMGHVWLQVLPVNSDRSGGVVPGMDPRLLLEEALMRRRLEKYPADFVAHFNLGAALDSMGRRSEAIQILERAVRIRPASATARNGLAAALLAEDRNAEAVPHLLEALRFQPDYHNARYNLARALAATGDLDRAETELLAYLRARPEDGDAHQNLGGMYLARQQQDKALPHLAEAARLKPRDADVQANYGTLLAIRGDLETAIHAFQQALRVNPNHQTARANLERASAELARKRGAR